MEPNNNPVPEAPVSETPAPEAPTISVEPIDSPKPTPQPEPKPAKSNKPLIWCLAILAIIGIVAAIVFAYLYFTTPTTPASTSNNNQSSTTTDEPTTVEETEIMAEVRQLVETLSSIASSETNTGLVKVYEGSILYKPDNAKTYITLDDSYGIYGFSNGLTIEESSAIYQALSAKLKELGFIEKSDFADVPLFLTGGTYYVNDNNGIICEVSDGIPFTTYCGHSSWFSEEKVALANQLAEAYFVTTGQYPFSIPSLNNYTIDNSTITPYQVLKTPVSNAMGLFYRTSPESEWQFFTATQALIDCSDFNTQDIKNAFTGEACWDNVTNQSSTVQP